MKLFVDHHCILCDATSNDDFCIACETELPWFPENHCPICLWPVPTSEVCGACLKKPPAFTRSIAVLRYTFSCRCVDSIVEIPISSSHRAHSCKFVLKAIQSFSPTTTRSHHSYAIAPDPFTRARF